MNNLSAQNLQNRGIARAYVLGYPVDIVSMVDALNLIGEFWQSHKPMHVVTLNAEMTMQSLSNNELGQIIEKADLVVPDGAGVILALRARGAEFEKVSRLPGIELAANTLETANRLGKKVALLGGKPEVMENLIKVVKEKYPGIKLTAAINGYFKEEEEAKVVEELAAESPDLLLVALGVPRQEYFIHKHRPKFPNTVMIGVGGSFDVWTGYVQRAPETYQKLHLEWLYRLIKEPWRFKRMAGTLPKFAVSSLLESLSGKMKATIARNPLQEALEAEARK